MDKNEIEIIENNEISTVNSGEGSIVISECDNIDKDKLIPIPKEASSQLSLMLSEVPSVANSIHNIQELGKTTYSITFKGNNVHPEQLAQKSNGSLFSNLRGEHGFGKQTDINPLYHTKAQIGNVVNIGFAVASVITSTYYLHAINSEINAISEEVKSIKNLIMDNIDSGVEEGTSELIKLYNELQQTEMSGVGLNERRLNYIIDRLASISEVEGKSARHYKKSIERSIEKHSVGKSKERKSSASDIEHDFFFYGISIKAYILAERLLAELTEANDADAQFESRMSERRDEYTKLYDEIRKVLREKVPSPKLATARLVGAILADTVIDKVVTEEGEEEFTVLTDKAGDAFSELYNERADKAVDDVLHYDKDFIKKFVEQIEANKASMQLEEVEIIVDDDGMYLMYEEESDEPDKPHKEQ